MKTQPFYGKAVHFLPSFPLSCPRHPTSFPQELAAPHLEQSLVSYKMKLMEQAAGAALA